MSLYIGKNNNQSNILHLTKNTETKDTLINNTFIPNSTLIHTDASFVTWEEVPIANIIKMPGFTINPDNNAISYPYGYGVGIAVKPSVAALYNPDNSIFLISANGSIDFSLKIFYMDVWGYNLYDVYHYNVWCQNYYVKDSAGSRQTSDTSNAFTNIYTSDQFECYKNGYLLSSTSSIYRTTLPYDLSRYNLNTIKLIRLSLNASTGNRKAYSFTNPNIRLNSNGIFFNNTNICNYNYMSMKQVNPSDAIISSSSIGLQLVKKIDNTTKLVIDNNKIEFSDAATNRRYLSSDYYPNCFYNSVSVTTFYGPGYNTPGVIHTGTVSIGSNNSFYIVQILKEAGKSDWTFSFTPQIIFPGQTNRVLSRTYDSVNSGYYKNGDSITSATTSTISYSVLAEFIQTVRIIIYALR